MCDNFFYWGLNKSLQRKTEKTSLSFPHSPAAVYIHIYISVAVSKRLHDIKNKTCTTISWQTRTTTYITLLNESTDYRIRNCLSYRLPIHVDNCNFISVLISCFTFCLCHTFLSHSWSYPCLIDDSKTMTIWCMIMM